MENNHKKKKKTFDFLIVSGGFPEKQLTFSTTSQHKDITTVWFLDIKSC